LEIYVGIVKITKNAFMKVNFLLAIKNYLKNMSIDILKKETEIIILKNLLKMYENGKFNKIRFVKLVIEVVEKS